MHSSSQCARFIGVVLCLATGALLPSASAAAEASLHAKIDVMITKRLLERKITPAVVCSDAEFVRRIYLDLSGRVPTSKQAREFLDDGNPEKRSWLFDELPASSEYALHMARIFDVMLTERRIPPRESSAAGNRMPTNR